MQQLSQIDKTLAKRKKKNKTLQSNLFGHHIVVDTRRYLLRGRQDDQEVPVLGRGATRHQRLQVLVHRLLGRPDVDVLADPVCFIFDDLDQGVRSPGNLTCEGKKNARETRDWMKVDLL